MASSRRTATNENVGTFGGAGLGRDYTLLATWEAATDIDLVTAAQSEVLECYDDAVFDDGDTIDGATTNASYFRIVRPAGTIGASDWEGHDGTPNVGVKFDRTNHRVFTVSESYLQLQDLVLTGTGNAASTNGCISVSSDYVVCVGCIVYDVVNEHVSYSCAGYHISSAVTAYFINCLAINTEGTGFLMNVASATMIAYNCLAASCGSYGFFRNNGTVTTKNCLATGNTTADWQGTIGTTTCTEEGFDSTNSLRFTDSANDDYSLATGAIIGTDLTADGTFAFDDDILGNPRPSCTRNVWSVGAFQPLSSRLIPLNAAVSTYGAGGFGRDYTALATWEAATDTDRVTAAAGAILDCYDDAASFDDNDWMDGTTTDACYFRVLRSAWGEGHNGTPKVGVSFVSTTGDSALLIREDYSQIQDVSVALSLNSASSYITTQIYDCDRAAMIGVLTASSTNIGAGNVHGLRIAPNNASNDNYAINCLEHDVDEQGFRHTNFVGTSYLYNCTADSNGTYGIIDAGTTLTVAKNCISTGNSTADWDGTITKTTNTEEGFDSTNGLIFEDSANDDFHLATGAIIGTDLSTDSEYAFNDDINDGVMGGGKPGRTRPTSTRNVWSVGMHQPLSCRLIPLNAAVTSYGAGGEGRDYTALATWEAATDTDRVTAEAGAILDCYNDAASFDDEDIFDMPAGGYTDANYFRVIRAAVGEGHDGTSNNGVHFSSTTVACVIDIQEDYFQSQDLIGTSTINNAADTVAFQIYNCDLSAIVACIADNTSNAGAGDCHGITVLPNNAAKSGIAINCLAHENDNSGFNFHTYAGKAYVYSCTSYGNDGGFILVDTTTVIIKNCLADSNTTNDFAGGGTFDTLDHVASEDAQADDFWTNTTKICQGATDGTTANHLIHAGRDFEALGVQVGMRIKNVTDTTWANVTAVASGDLTIDSDIFVSGEAYEIGSVFINQSFVFENAGGDDFHKSESSDGVGVAKDMSNDAYYPFEDSIDVDGGAGGGKVGTIRTDPWDLGFDTYVAAAAGGIVPLLMHLYQQQS